MKNDELIKLTDQSIQTGTRNRSGKDKGNS